MSGRIWWVLQKHRLSGIFRRVDFSIKNLPIFFFKVQVDSQLRKLYNIFQWDAHFKSAPGICPNVISNGNTIFCFFMEDHNFKWGFSKLLLHISAWHENIYLKVKKCQKNSISQRLLVAHAISSGETIL